MLARAGLGNDLGFTHALGKQGLAQHLVGFMRATVKQIFTLEVERGSGSSGQILAFGERGRTTGIVFQQIAELGLKRRIFLGADKGLFQLAQGRHQNLRNVHAAKFTEVGIKQSCHYRFLNRHAGYGKPRPACWHL